MKTHALPRTFVTLLALLPLLAVPSASRAALQFTLNPNTLAGKAGDTLTFFGTLTNTGSSTLFLNSDTFNLAAAGLSIDDSGFFNNFPLSLNGGASASGNLFTVAVSSLATSGPKTGSFTILGGPTDSDFNSLATQNFTVNVAPTSAAPEPGSQALLLCGGMMLGIVGTVKRRRNATK